MRLITIATIFTIVLAACSAAANNEALPGRWDVSEFSDASGELNPPLEGTFLTAMISDQDIAGFSGCNTYSGNTTLDGQDVSFGPFASTLKACPLPEGVMDQEAEYLSLLQTVDAWEPTDEGANLKVSGVTVITLVAIDTELAGSSWDVTAINNQNGGVQSIVAASEPTIAFDDEDGVTGNTGCNNFFGEYTIDGNSITFSQIGMTEMFCEQTAEQETWMIAALEQATTYTNDGRTFELFDADGSRLLTANKG